MNQRPWMEMARWHTSTEHMPQGGKDTLSFEIRHQNRADAQPPRGVFSRHRKFSERGRKGRTSRPVAWPRLPPRSFLHGEHRCFHSGSESWAFTWWRHCHAGVLGMVHGAQEELSE